MKENILKGIVSTVSASLLAYFGALAIPLLILFAVMVLDYITGMSKAYMLSQLSSRTGIKGIIKKLCYMVMVAVGAVLDYLLGSALVQAGMDLHISMFCGLLVTIWLIINELLSIVENLAAIGVPSFTVFNGLIKRLKNTVEDRAEKESEGKE